MYKKKTTFLLVFIIVLNLVSCNKSNKNENEYVKDDLSTSSKEKTIQDMVLLSEEELLKTNFSESNTYSFSELELYKETNIDKEKYEIRILDSDKNKVLFTMDSKREDKRLAEGILLKTEALYVYSIENKKFDVIRKFKEHYIMQGYFVNEKYIAVGIKLGEKDTNYSVFYGDGGRLNEIYKGENTWYFSMWPSLIKLNSGIILLEPQIESGEKDDIITGVKLFRLQNDELIKIDFQIPDDFELLSSETESDLGSFVTFWENKKEKKSYFVLVDEKGLKKIIPFPKQYKLMNFTLLQNKVIASVEVGHEKKYKILSFDLDNKTLYANDFPYVLQMLSLFSGKKTIIRTDDHIIYLMEFKDNELYLEKVNIERMDESLLSRKILFTDFGDKIILTIYDETKRFMELEIR